MNNISCHSSHDAVSDLQVVLPGTTFIHFTSYLASPNAKSTADGAYKPPMIDRIKHYRNSPQWTHSQSAAKKEILRHAPFSKHTSQLSLLQSSRPASDVEKKTRRRKASMVCHSNFDDTGWNPTVLPVNLDGTISATPTDTALLAKAASLATTTELADQTPSNLTET